MPSEVGMPLSPPSAHRDQSPAPEPTVGGSAWIYLLFALLPAEVLGLSLIVATRASAAKAAWQTAVAALAPSFTRLAIVIGMMTLLFGARLRAAYRDRPTASHFRSVRTFLVSHFTAFAVLAVLTAFPPQAEGPALLWTKARMMAWFLLAGLTVGLWAAALLSARRPSLLREVVLFLLCGIAIGVLVWAAAKLTDRLWIPLSRGTFWAVRGLLESLVSDPVCQPDDFVIGTRQFVVHIAPSCSGYEGIGLLWGFLAVYFWLYRQELHFSRALWILPLATAAIWFANAVRITALIALGTWGSPEVALGGFHSQAGWLAFNAIALGTVVLTQQIRWFHKRPEELPPNRTATTACLLVPLLVLLATMMVASAFQGEFDWLYPARVLAVGAALFYFRRRYAGLFHSWSWPAVLIGAGVFLLWLALEPASPEEARTVLPPALAGVPTGWAVVWLVFRVVGSVVTVPLAEELAFRGYLPRRLQAADVETVPLGRFTWPSFLVSSLLFGFLHGRWLAGTLAGMCYAWALYRRRDLSDPVLAHSVTNALVAAYVLATGTWSLWS